MFCLFSWFVKPILDSMVACSPFSGARFYTWKNFFFSSWFHQIFSDCFFIFIFSRKLEKTIPNRIVCSVSSVSFIDSSNQWMRWVNTLLIQNLSSLDIRIHPHRVRCTGRWQRSLVVYISVHSSMLLITFIQDFLIIWSGSFELRFWHQSWILLRKSGAFFSFVIGR